MTDLEIFKNMLMRAGIKFTEEVLDTAAAIRASRPKEHEGQTTITIEAGYPCFYSIAIFDKSGMLKTIEAYE